MKVSLVVLTPGKMEGKTIPITLSQFLIGRDPQCHLRPASPVISKRHCVVIIRNGKVYIRDFDSTNGTHVNDQPIKVETELTNGDELKVGPISFRVNIVAAVPVDMPTPMPMTRARSGNADDDSAGDLLLSILDEGGPAPENRHDVPEGSTIMDLKLPPPGEGQPKPAAKAPAASTSNAAKAILEKYMRRPRAT